jgi:plasmid maintenance system killer protein
MISSGMPMEIVFASKRLQRACATEAQRKQSYPHCASQLNRRMGQLAAADNLAVMATLPGHCHELTADCDGQLGIDVSGNYRVIFCPDHGEVPLKPDGGLDWSKVTRIMILEVRDYHGH